MALNNHAIIEADEKSCTQFSNCYFGFWGDPGGGRAGLKGMFSDLKSNHIDVIIKALTYIADGHLGIRGKPLINDIQLAIQITQAPSNKKNPKIDCQYCRGFGYVDVMRSSITHETIKNDSKDFETIVYHCPHATCYCIGGNNPEYIWTIEQISEFFKQKQQKTKEKQ